MPRVDTSKHGGGAGGGAAGGGGGGIPVWLQIPSQGLGGRLRLGVLASEEEAILLSGACTFKKAP